MVFDDQLKINLLRISLFKMELQHLIMGLLAARSTTMQFGRISECLQTKQSSQAFPIEAIIEYLLVYRKHQTNCSRITHDQVQV